jgi:esterase/lipase superfamily enzyme
MSYDYIITARNRKNDEFTAEPGPVSFIRVPSDETSYDDSHIVSSTKAWLSEVQGLADGDENPNSISPRGDVLVFVHGYNNDIPIILKRTRQLRADLKAEGWRGEIVAFDWPSSNQTLNYLEDRSDGADVARELVTKCIFLLMKGQKAGCETNVHLIGHSTGAYVIMEAFAQAENKGEIFKSDWRMGQVVFIGADVAQSSLSQTSDWAAPMFKRAMRLTNYSNPYDSVLASSNAKRLGISPRAGRVGLPADANAKSVDVSCGEYFDALNPNAATYFGSWTHSWHIGNRVFARDLAMTLEGAIDRNAIPTRRAENVRLILQDASRPRFQSEWRVKDASQNATARI